MSRTTARTARARRRNRQLDRVTLIVLIAFLALASITAVMVIILVRNMLTTPLDGSRAVSGAQNGNPVAFEKMPATPAGPLQRDTDPTPVPWDGKSRITLLLMGLDYRDWEDGTDVPRTDSMILFSLDPQSMTAGMLSIPRDTWVNVPGMGENKINTAYRWGEVYSVPGGGPGLAMQTVEQFLGVPVDYYALIDFNAFVRFIDEMGGLDMHIKEKIVVDPIGPGNTKTLEPGVQTLDGATVLAYARQRYTDHDDFDRSRRQQEVIMAIRDQVLQFNMLPTLIAKSPKLYQEISSGISTNLTLSQVIQLARLAAQVPEENIKKGVISPPKQVRIDTASDGQSILVPEMNEIRLLRDEVFEGSGPIAPRAVTEVQPTAEPTSPPITEEQIRKDHARVIIRNGTSTEGLATKTGESLKSLGVNIIGEENADAQYPVTTINDYSGKRFMSTIDYIIEKLNLPNARIYYNNVSNAEADIEIILGNDFASQQ